MPRALLRYSCIGATSGPHPRSIAARFSWHPPCCPATTVFYRGLHEMLPRYSCRLALALVAFLSAGASRATAASKMKIAATGDAAPGGGVFAGPGFSGWPTAAGNGWIAFRGRITGGRTGEAIIATRQAPPRTTVQVASKGQSAPGGGTFRQFFGRPAVNARGDVAFLALVNDATVPDDPSLPTPAGLFVYSAATGQLTAVPRSRQPTVLGVLDIATTLAPNADPSAVDLPDRTAALKIGRASCRERV